MLVSVLLGVTPISAGRWLKQAVVQSAGKARRPRGGTQTRVQRCCVCISAGGVTGAVGLSGGSPDIVGRVKEDKNKEIPIVSWLMAERENALGEVKRREEKKRQKKKEEGCGDR